MATTRDTQFEPGPAGDYDDEDGPPLTDDDPTPLIADIELPLEADPADVLDQRRDVAGTSVHDFDELDSDDATLRRVDRDQWP